MKIFSKTRLPNGYRDIYFCGIKVFSYFNKSQIPDYRRDVYTFRALNNCKKLKTLIVGSSHGRDAFIPSIDECNLSNSSQDLYRMYKLYEYVVEHNGRNLKNVLVFWSVFHPGLQLEKTKNCLHCVPYKFLYDIDYACEMYPIDARVIKNIEKLMADITVPDNYRGKSFYTPSTSNDTAEKVAAGHIKNAMRNNNQIQYLGKIVDLARRHKHNVYVVLPPYRQDYQNCLPVDDEIYFELFNFLKHHRNVRLLNFQHDADFDDADFRNSDHCSERGGRKLTRKIKQLLKD